jgi:hypothetical protein
MLRHCSALLAAAALCATAATARADVYDPARVTTSVIDNGNGTFVQVCVRSVWGHHLEGQVTLMADGRTIKLDPIDTYEVQYVATRVGDPGTSVYACGTFDGVAWVGSGDGHEDLHITHCVYHTAEMGTHLAPRPAETARLPAGARTGLSPRIR